MEDDNVSPATRAEQSFRPLTPSHVNPTGLSSGFVKLSQD